MDKTHEHHPTSIQDWTKPVGYHVTLPCSADQAGYRTFDTAFAMERGDGVTMDLVQVKAPAKSMSAFPRIY